MPFYRALPIVLGLAIGSSAFAAKVPDLRSFGAPSAGLEATWADTLEFEDGSGGLDLSSLRFDVPLWGGKIDEDAYGLELKYDWTQFDLSPAAVFGETDLHSLDLSARWAHFPKERGWLGLLKVTAGVGSDFQDFSSDAFQASILGFWGYQTSPQFSWAVAGFASYSLGDVMAYPSIGFVWSPTEAWRIQLTPPLAIVSWKPDNNWRLAFTFLPNGGSWQVENREGVEQVDLSLWSAAFSVERRLAENLFVSVRAGVNLGGEIELRNGNEEVQFNRDLDPAAFASLGVRWEF